MCFRTLTDLFNKYGKRWQVKIPHKYGGYFRNDADHRDYVGIGTAAGQCPSSTFYKRTNAYLLVAFLLVEHLPCLAISPRKQKPTFWLPSFWFSTCPGFTI